MRPANWIVAATLALAVAAPPPALAWGSLGHRIIGEVAAKNFPASVPAFLRSADAVRRIGELAREPDRSRNAGEPHDADLDPAHFLDVSDDGTVLGGPKLAALPASRLDFDTALRAAGSNEYKAGYLPYAIMEGWQQLVKDFSLWRVDAAAMTLAKARADRKYFTDDRALRQLITLRDLGFWAHFVGDASQPMHVSVHYNAGGDGPNPEGFETTAGLHAKFETDFVNANIGEADVAALLRPYRDCTCTIQNRTQDYLIATQGVAGRGLSLREGRRL